MKETLPRIFQTILTSNCGNRNLVFYLKKLRSCILKEKIKKIYEAKLSKEQKKKLTLIDGTTDTYYQYNVTEDILQEDALVKEYLINSIPM